MNNMDMSKMLEMLSKMDPKDLENGLAQAAKVLNSKDKDTIINEIQKKNNN